MYDSVLLSNFFLQEINLLMWGHLSCHCYSWLKGPAYTVVLRHTVGESLVGRRRRNYMMLGSPKHAPAHPTQASDQNDD